jgi:hypothetical protein
MMIDVELLLLVNTASTLTSAVLLYTYAQSDTNNLLSNAHSPTHRFKTIPNRDSRVGRLTCS